MVTENFTNVELMVSNQSGSYKGLSEDALLTCEEDFRSIFSCLPDVTIWVELGSGHGLGPILFASLHPDKAAIGIEFETARFSVGENYKNESRLKNVQFINADLLTCDLPLGDVYFLYFSTGIVLDRILCELGKRTDYFKVVAIESHGDLLPRLSQENWLRSVQKIPLKSARHFPHAIIFEKFAAKNPSLHDKSFCENYLLIASEDGSEWIGESYGLEWSPGEKVHLLTPPRTVCISQVKNVFNLDDIQVKFHSALQLRKLGLLTFCTPSGNKEGYLRKIFVSPSFSVEISSGEQVEWGDIGKIFWGQILCYDSSSDYFFYPHVV